MHTWVAHDQRPNAVVKCSFECLPIQVDFDIHSGNCTLFPLNEGTSSFHRAPALFLDWRLSVHVIHGLDLRLLLKVQSNDLTEQKEDSERK